MYDVRGTLTYSDDMNTIIFLAPVSCLDEVSDEDPRVNHTDDRLSYGRTYVGSLETSDRNAGGGNS